MSSDNRKDPAKGKAFQMKAGTVLGEYFGVRFKLDQALPIGKPTKLHKFDLVSENGRYVGECKNYRWTRGRNMPSAKMAVVNEAVFLLKHLPRRITRFVVMRKDLKWDGKETLAQYYERTYRHLLGGVMILEMNFRTGALQTVAAEDGKARFGK
ncbi:MAG: hypothetical protein A2Z92_06145 [Omnitrophica WOR_2 bacterium GWA2_63_20]|nr:MAG: hypothetical protein A2Z92_06145 [Omnitrophica WOR_2 bacterium GWA2_63_20]OGX16731.1 MAG: hypothetical protein A2105_03245 [Omnitrophica WOR_2 bacterium GWF2_63_9]HAM40348.1 hypothetical protein [Candidatus Omnitrophota bacterium]